MNDVAQHILDPEEEGKYGSVFDVTVFGEVVFGGGGPNEGWIDCLGPDKAKELYECLKVFYETSHS